MVDNAFHAVAMDEHRPDFAATMWSAAKTPGEGQRVEQRFFPGSHGDVGGGYPHCALPDISLHWMQNRAAECGLQFSADVATESDAFLAPMHDSLGEFALGLYANLPWIYPYYRPMGLGVNEVIDDSVWNRIASSQGKDERGKKYSPPAVGSRTRPHG